MICDYTPVLKHLFEEKRRAAASPTLSQNNTQKTESHVASATHSSLPLYPKLLEVSLQLASTAATSSWTAMTLIHRVMSTLDLCSVHSSAPVQLESDLRLAEAELLSTSDSIRTTLENIVRAAEQQPQSHCSDLEEGQSECFLLDDASIHSIQGEAPHSCGRGGRKGRVPHFLAHISRILEEARRRIMETRIQLALCKEELREERARLHWYATMGVKPLEAPLLECCLDSDSSSNSGEDGEVDDDEEVARRPSPPPPTTMQLRMMTGSKSLLEGVLQSVATTVLPAMEKEKERGKGASAADQHSSSTVQERRTVSSDPPPRPRRSSTNDEEGGAAGASSIAFYHPLSEYSTEELRQLTHERAALEEKQRLTLAEDAVAVETAVRDLGTLNSLVSELIVTQHEKFSVVLRNTEEAEGTMKKAVVELEKPLGSFWNPNRQLIAVLWVAMAVLLISNWLL